LTCHDGRGIQPIIRHSDTLEIATLMSIEFVSAPTPSGSDSSSDNSALQSLPACPASIGRNNRGWQIWGLFVVAGILALGVDVTLSRVMVHGHAIHWQGPLREWVHDFLGSFEPFGQPPAIIAVSLAVYLCGGRRRGAALRIAGSFLLASLAANFFKLCVARVRPVFFFKQHFDFGGTVLDTFQGLFWGTAGGTANQSFPSGHTTVAVAFSLALSAVFPRGRWLFATLAGLVALQRIECGAHYLSDTLFAASLAYVVHRAVFGDGPLGRWINRLESKLSGV
jgi:membrane-associated phospholipid phosphatase